MFYLRLCINIRALFGEMMVDEKHCSDEKKLPAADAVQPRTVRSDELFGGQRIVLIEHAGQQYRLLITRNDRLILQK